MFQSNPKFIFKEVDLVIRGFGYLKKTNHIHKPNKQITA